MRCRTKRCTRRLRVNARALGDLVIHEQFARFLIWTVLLTSQQTIREWWYRHP